MPIYSRVSRVYWSDTDAARIAHFTSFFKYCEATEEEFILDLLKGHVKDHRVVFPRVRAECQYRSPLRPHDEYRVDIAEIVVGRKSLTYSFRVYNLTTNSLSAECNITAVAYDVERMESVEIPGFLRKLLIERGARSKE